jgi:phosphatidylinositol glycan class Z
MAASEKALAQKSWSLYNLLILIRVCIAPFLLGYVHPDEFFQGGQELWFGCPPTRSWEFEPENALRSVVPPTIMTWWPLELYAGFLMIPMEQLSGWHVWIVPRVACAIFSIFAVDFSVWALSRPTKGVPLPVLMVASAWPAMVLLNRPFTNAMETWVLAVLFRVVLYEKRSIKKPKPSISFFQCLAVGALSALGVFTRFTFVCFACPIILYFGYKMIRQLGFFGWIIKPVAAYCAFLMVASEIVDRDSEFYSSTSPVLTPWNALSYNSQVENLSEHGLHPRWTHVLVNMFILYGPMTLMTYILFVKSSAWVVGEASVTDGADDPLAKARTAVFLSKWIIVFGLGLLSLAPHQEPRFLLPLLVPLALLSDNPWMREHFYQQVSTVWIAFNGTLLLLFGVLHQAGVVPSLLALGSSLLDRDPKAVVFYHTYMPPTFLSRPARASRDCSGEAGTVCLEADRSCKDIPILDLNGSNDIDSLETILLEQLPCDNFVKDAYVHIVSSPLTEIILGERWYLGKGRCAIPGYACESIWNHSPHLSTEEFPSVASLVQEGLPLSIYEVSCISHS